MTARAFTWLAGIGLAAALFIGSLLATVTAAGVAFDRSSDPRRSLE